MEKVEQQKQIIRKYKEKIESQQEGFNEQGESQINFLQIEKEIEIPEQVEYLWMNFLIQEEKENIDRIAISQMINLNHIIGETAYIKEVEELLKQYDEIISKGSHDIKNCIMVKHAIHFIIKKPI